MKGQEFIRMSLTSPKTIAELLEKYQIKPNKTLGQNFLIDKNILDKIINTADLKKDDIVLEVGPGIGTLTQELAKKAGKVIAVEKDAKMVEILRETLSEYKNVKIENCDILKFIENWKLKIKNYKVIANIPYYLTSHLIRIFLEAKNPPTEIVLLIQKEVAKRIVAKPPNMSLLSVSVQYYAEPKIISYVSKNCFLPPPKVDSAIIKLSQIHANLPQIDTNLFFKIAKAGFSQPRKQLANNFARNLKLSKEEVASWLSKNNIKPAQRAETLCVQDWERLTKSFPQQQDVDLFA